MTRPVILVTPYPRTVEMVWTPDVQARLAELAEGATARLRVAIDVHPVEPVAPDDPIRQTPNILFTLHLAGALHASYARIRAALLDDAAQILAGKPPMPMQTAQPRLAAMSISR